MIRIKLLKKELKKKKKKEGWLNKVKRNEIDNN